MSIGLGDIYLTSIFLILRFGLVWFGWQNQNRKLNQTMRLIKKMIRIHANQMRFFAISVWISSVYGFSIGLVRF